MNEPDRSYVVKVNMVDANKSYLAQNGRAYHYLDDATDAMMNVNRNISASDNARQFSHTSLVIHTEE